MASTHSNVVIWGAGGHAKAVADALLLTDKHKLVGFIDDLNPHRSGDHFMGSRILGGVEAIRDLAEGGADLAVVAIGDNNARERAAGTLMELGFSLPEVCHPSAIISPSSTLGAGAVCLARSVIQASAQVGDHVLVNTGAIVEHDCVVGTASHICPGSILTGNVRIGERVLIGAGSVVLPGIEVEDDAVVGAGSVVTRRVPKGMTVVGSPARPVQ